MSEAAREPDDIDALMEEVYLAMPAFRMTATLKVGRRLSLANLAEIAKDLDVGFREMDRHYVRLPRGKATQLRARWMVHGIHFVGNEVWIDVCSDRYPRDVEELVCTAVARALEGTNVE